MANATCVSRQVRIPEGPLAGVTLVVSRRRTVAVSLRRRLAEAQRRRRARGPVPGVARG